jgi:hypothetical protein
MEKWNVSPNDGVSGSGPEFTFPQNTSNVNKEYTVTYTSDEGCTASLIYVVEKCEPQCQSAFTATLLDDSCKKITWKNSLDGDFTCTSEEYTITGVCTNCNGEYVDPSITIFPPIPGWAHTLTHTGTSYTIKIWFNGDYTVGAQTPIYPKIKHPDSDDGKLEMTCKLCKPTLYVYYHDDFSPNDKTKFNVTAKIEKGYKTKYHLRNRDTVSVRIDTTTITGQCDCVTGGAFDVYVFSSEIDLINTSGYTKSCPANQVPYICAESETKVCYLATSYWDAPACTLYEDDKFVDTGTDDIFNYEWKDIGL